MRKLEKFTRYKIALFCGVLIAFLISFPIQSTAQVIIKEKLELTDSNKSILGKASVQNEEYSCCYLHVGGQYSLRIGGLPVVINYGKKE